MILQWSQKMTCRFSATLRRYGCDKMSSVTAQNPSQLHCMIKAIIPPLEENNHKGQAGRVAVIGGCQEYTGAPYFAAITALKVGADLSHVICTSSASPVIKSYSPELIVHPILDGKDAVKDASVWLPRFHSIVIGPGLGRDEGIHQTVASIICKAKELNVPIIIDADGLHLITNNPSIIAGYKNAILTPNVAEFSRLYDKVVGGELNEEEPAVNSLQRLCKKLGNLTIVKKGKADLISDGEHVIACSEPGSPRRCGGQGDLLSGSMGTFFFWARKQLSNHSENLTDYYGPQMCAAYSACVLIRECSRLAFAEKGRSMTASDLVPQIQSAFENIFNDVKE